MPKRSVGLKPWKLLSRRWFWQKCRGTLRWLGRFARDYGQEIRVEVHGHKSQEIPVMKNIFDVVDQPSVPEALMQGVELVDDLGGCGRRHTLSLSWFVNSA